MSPAYTSAAYNRMIQQPSQRKSPIRSIVNRSGSGEYFGVDGEKSVIGGTGTASDTGRISGPQINLKMDEGGDPMAEAMKKWNAYRGREISSQVDALEKDRAKQEANMKGFLRMHQAKEWTPELIGKYSGMLDRQRREDAAKEAKAARQAFSRPSGIGF